MSQLPRLEVTSEAAPTEARAHGTPAWAPAIFGSLSCSYDPNA